MGRSRVISSKALELNEGSLLYMLRLNMGACLEEEVRYALDRWKCTWAQKQRSSIHIRGKRLNKDGDRNGLASSGSNCKFGEANLGLKGERMTQGKF